MKMLSRIARIATIVVFCGSLILLLYKISINGRYRIVIGDITETNSRRVNDELVTSNKVVSKCFLVDTSTGRVFVYEHDHWETIEGKQLGSVGFHQVENIGIR